MYDATPVVERQEKRRPCAKKQEHGGDNVNFTDKSILVTGAGGFIGHHLTRRLVESGARVRAFVRYNSRNDQGLLELLDPALREEIDVQAGDLRDPNAVSRAVHGTDVVFHLAAAVSIPYSYVHPREVVETNVLGTLNVLMAAVEHDTPRVVHTSSSEVYGTAVETPISESHPLQGQSPYSASKIGADKLAESFQRSYELPVATIRPFNTYGPGQSARAVIPTIITQAIAAGRIYLGSTHPTRDLTYVDDTVAGFLAVASSEEAVGRVTNIGTGREISIGDVAAKIVEIVGKDVPIVREEERVRPPRSEVEQLVADASKAESLLGWKPAVPLEEGLRRTVEWVSQHIERYKTVYNV
ncbi:MAG: SDR family NAD(P)-dependent oxidoreductase [Actinobacteria bacterium]|nr:MAG: SDR family NAD(P)-dependent oxidoreductase [Actinomycetota bacterium]